VDYVLQACEVIAEAHLLGIVHRDLKPSNLFLTFRIDGAPLVKVLDFGISKMPLGATDMQLTSSATVMGTPYYMAPEQMRSMKLVTPRSDIWGMGTVLYELLSARRAFNGRSITEICTQVLMQSPAPLNEAPPELGAIVSRCLEKDAAKRFGSMAELAAALAPFAPALMMPAPAPRVSAPAPAPMTPVPGMHAPVHGMSAPAPGTPLAAPLIPSAAARPSSMAPWVVIGVLLFMVAAAIAVLLVIRRG
ncbi:MAG: protein kinase, partial [Minicystis sp.]